MKDHPRSLTTFAVIAIIFGLLSIVSGGRALFSGVDMGAVVPFVLWFNFLAGFAYVAAGFGLWLRARWAAGLAVAIALATAAVFAAFLWHVSTGAAFEARTMGAMVLRLAFWVATATMAYLSGRTHRA